jgi:hypothetical protein
MRLVKIFTTFYKARYAYHKSFSLSLVLSQMNPTYILTSHTVKFPLFPSPVYLGSERVQCLSANGKVA